MCKSSPENTQPENMYDIVFEKAKGRGGTENRTIVYTKAAGRRVLMSKGVMRNFAELTGKNLCRNLFLIKLISVDLQLY